MLARKQVHDAMVALKPTLRSLAKMTDTKIDDALCDFYDVALETELMQEWLAEQVAAQSAIPPGAMAMVVPPQAVLEIFRRRQAERPAPAPTPDSPPVEDFIGNGTMLTKFVEMIAPMLIQILLKSFGKKGIL